MAAKPVLDLITKIFGNKALSKTIGTRTNVITIPDASVKRLLNTELNINAASDSQLEKFRIDAEKLISEIPKMNDQELLIFKGNLQRYYDRMFPPSADVFDFQTKSQVPKKGIEQLETELGIPSNVDPDSPLGQVMLRTKQIEKEGKNLAKEFGVEDDLKKGVEGLSKIKKEGNIPFTQITPEGEKKGVGTADELFDLITKNPYRSGGPLDQSSGIVRTATRQILRKLLDEGKIEIPDAVERKAIAEGYQGGVDPIEVFRKRFGEDALQDVDELADELNRAGDFKEIDDILERNKLFDIQPKDEYGYDPNALTDEELRKLLKDADVDPDDTGFKNGGRVKYAFGSGKKLLTVLADLGKNLKAEIRKAINNANLTGDTKLDADIVVDEMLELNNIDKDVIDGYDILDAYDEAYRTLKQDPDGMLDLEGQFPGVAKQMEQVKQNQVSRLKADRILKRLGLDVNQATDEQIRIADEYGDMLGDDLLAKMLADNDPNRIAEVEAAIKEAMLLQQKGMEPDAINDVIRQGIVKRTKQSNGGLAYLMGL